MCNKQKVEVTRVGVMGDETTQMGRAELLKTVWLTKKFIREGSVASQVFLISR